MTPQTIRTHRHQYVERHTGRIVTEKLYGDALVSLLYSGLREKPGWLFNALTSARISSLLGFLNYDALLGTRLAGNRKFLKSAGIDWSECLVDPQDLKSAREVFERQIRYWQCRPMPAEQDAVLSPADSRMIAGSLSETSALFVKGKFFDYEELLGTCKHSWLDAFRGGDYAVFRLTPDKYHYNHVPVSGQVIDFYDIPGRYHSCNPVAVLTVATPCSKNKRVVTVLDTDVPGGSRCGLVAMIEVAALMIGEIVQCYSEEKYEAPLPVAHGMFLRRGSVKSLFRPGSSTDVLLFQKGRVRFAGDLLANLRAPGVQSRFSSGLGNALVETDVMVRSSIGKAVRTAASGTDDLRPGLRAS